MAFKYIGKDLKRVDAVEKVTGEAKYTADLKFPRMLHAKILRSEYAHAKILSIDISEAEKCEGVHKVITGQNCDILFGTCIYDQPPIAVDRVRHIGDPVAAVVADTERNAELAVKKIKVEYEPLPVYINAMEAVKSDAMLIHEKNGEYFHISSALPEKGTNIFHHYKLRKGDINEGFKDAEVFVEGDFEWPLNTHAAMEPHATICRWDHDKSLNVWTTNQGPNVVCETLARIFAIPNSKVRIHVPYLGGGFGGKSDVITEPLVAYIASFLPGYTVKMVLTRKEVFGTILGRGLNGKMKIGATKDGKLTGINASLYFTDGAYADTGFNVVTVAGHNCTGPYEFENCHIDSYGVYTNTPMVGAYRGYGHPEGAFMVERLLDILARKLNMSPFELREKNFLSEGKKNSLGQTVQNYNGDVLQCMNTAKKAIFESPKPQEDDKYIYGRGVAAMMKSPKMSPNAATSVFLRFFTDGSVSVNMCGIEMGQGSRTVFTQITAEALMIPPEKITVYNEVDTQFSPWDWQTVASMLTYRGGNAIIKAAKKAIKIMKETAAEVLQCMTDDLEYNGECVYRKSNKSINIPIAQLVVGYMHPGGLTVGEVVHALGEDRIPGVVNPDPDTGMGYAAGSWTFGSQAVQLKIEKATGKVIIEHFASCFDIGQVINPHTLMGQITGGVTMGIGHALHEDLKFTPEGKMKNGVFGAYKIPTIYDIPEKQTIGFVETADVRGPFGARCIGEHPIVAVTPAILNAIQDATGHDFYKIPVTPEDILNVLKERN